MTVQRTDLFHCISCGRVVFHPHGAIAPTCCQQPMVCAVSDVVKDASQHQRTDAERQLDVEQHALLAEASSIANWCHSFTECRQARRQEVVQRLCSLRDALCDQFDLEEQEGDLAKILALDARFSDGVRRLRNDHHRLLSLLDCIMNDLRNREQSASDWSSVCQRLDSLTASFRRHENAEGDLVRLAAHAGFPARG